MTISREESIYDYLTSFSDILAQVDSENIAWVDVPEERTYPRIKYVIMTQPTLFQTDDQWQRWRFYVIGADKIQVKLITDILNQKLNRAYGDIGGLEYDLIVELDRSEMLKREDRMYETYSDFRVLYH